MEGFLYLPNRSNGEHPAASSGHLAKKGLPGEHVLQDATVGGSEDPGDSDVKHTPSPPPPDTGAAASPQLLENPPIHLFIGSGGQPSCEFDIPPRQRAGRQEGSLGWQA